MVLMVLLMVSCSGEEELLKIKRDIANIQEQIYAIEKNQVELQSGLQERLKDVDQKLSDRTVQADTQDQLQTIKQDLSQYKALVHDLESRVAELKRAGAQVTLNTPTSDANQPMGETVDGADNPTPPATTAPSQVSGDVVGAQYRQAKLDYDRGKFEVAQVGFEDVLNNFPGSPFEERARYYLGTIFFNNKDYQKAREQFAVLTTQYGKGDFVKQAMYYEGRCYYQLRQPSKAVLTLRELIEAYPDTQEAELAQTFLKRKGYER
jgi:tol-pal system protein YbgF